MLLMRFLRVYQRQVSQHSQLTTFRNGVIAVLKLQVFVGVTVYEALTERVDKRTCGYLSVRLADIYCAK